MFDWLWEVNRTSSDPDRTERLARLRLFSIADKNGKTPLEGTLCTPEMMERIRIKSKYFNTKMLYLQLLAHATDVFVSWGHNEKTEFVSM